MSIIPSEPALDCPLCPRLAYFRRENRRLFPTYHNNPVSCFGPIEAELLIVGLAPGLHGANQTGRPFTGDYAGDLLYNTLKKFGRAVGDYQERADDGLKLVKTRIVNAVRCVPPANKPIGAEINQCMPFLTREIAAMRGHLRVIMTLGTIAHTSTLGALGAKPASFRFGHNQRHKLDGLIVVNSYHCSRYNTNTGRLTESMFVDVFHQIDEIISSK